MFVEKVKSEGLAHLSYVVGAGAEAAVIDPRRDWDIYVELARRNGCRITHIFETHRNEDLVSGAAALSAATGAPVHHGPNPEEPVVYADTVREGDSFELGSLKLRVFETPGHTDDSLSFAIHDTDFGKQAVGVFTGDCLFIGDVGRTDFYPDRAEEVAGRLYDSLFKTLLPLGDQCLVYPAHGAGSVCGSGMADREFSSLGYERLNNPMLQITDRDAFVRHKVNEHHYQPPYFRAMERINIEGAAGRQTPLAPPPLPPKAFAALVEGGAVPVDTRGVTAFLGSHVPGSLALPVGMIPAFAGWLLETDTPIALIASDGKAAEQAARHLARIGYDGVRGMLKGGLASWATTGKAFTSAPVVDVEQVMERVSAKPKGWTLLDVRALDEIEAGIIPGARHIYVGELPTKLDHLSKDDAITVMCGSGARATVAASVLLRHGFRNVDVFLGSMQAWKARGQETVEPGEAAKAA